MTKKKIRLGFAKYSANGIIGALKAIHLQEDGAADDLSTLKHCHDYYELVVVVSGDGYHKFNDEMIPLRRGQIFLVQPGVEHCYSGFRKIVVQNFMFPRQALSLIRSALYTVPRWRELFCRKSNEPVCMVGSSVISELDLLQNTIALEQQQSAESRSLLLLSYLAQLLGIVLNNMIQPDKQSKGGGGDIENAALFMRDNYKKNIKLPDLAKMSYMSVSRFIKRFSTEFGMPPMRYLLKLRLHQAQKQLMRSEESITEVALTCGFHDPLYFTRQFRRHFGCTPSEYRLHGQGRIQITNGEYQHNDNTFLVEK